jgi:hypothetical protein
VGNRDRFISIGPSLADKCSREEAALSGPAAVSSSSTSATASGKMHQGRNSPIQEVQRLEKL